MLSVVVMGECMVEFSPTVDNCYQQSFAGDVYNTAVYLKRLQKKTLDVILLTAIGNDVLSDRMLADFRSNEINNDYVVRVKDRQPGAYLIQNSDEGERSFVYWRETSAAKVVMSQLNGNDKVKLSKQCEIFYFSGISIAILDTNEREIFWKFVDELRDCGAKIVFDSNFRGRLWSSIEDAKKQFTRALSLSDIVFAGAEDFSLLYQLDDFVQLDEFLNQFSINELIIKNGAESVFYRSGKTYFMVDVVEVENVVDTTSAGDAFNSGFLNAKINGFSAQDAIEQACKISGFVIQHKGAIIPQHVFNDFITAEQI